MFSHTIPFVPTTDVSDHLVDDIVDLFPKESHPTTISSVTSIVGLVNGGIKNQQELRTRVTRRLHYFMWVYNMNYADNLWLENCDHRRRVYQFAQYTAHLCTGHTIHSKAIRYNTVLRYLHDAATFVKLQTGIDPRFELGSDSFAEPIQRILAEYKRWEEVPNRREPWTIAMQDALDDHNNNIDHPSRDDLLNHAIADWCGLGLSTGYRKGEWAQPTQAHADIRNPDTKDWRGIIPAMLPEDFTFYDNTGRRIRSHQLAVSYGISRVSKVRIKWRVQKNGDNGESKTYLRNTVSPNLCPVNRALSIVARHIRLVGTNEPNVPLGLYQHPTHGVQLIVATDVASIMRRTVAQVLGLDPIKDAEELAKWSTHSLRVGACQVLYASGFHAHEIKMLLRWKSDSFMKYLRDIAWVAKKRTDAMNDIASNDEVGPLL